MHLREGWLFPDQNFEFRVAWVLAWSQFGFPFIFFLPLICTSFFGV